MENERMETWRAGQEFRVQKRITELHRTLDSPVNFGQGEEVPHLGGAAAHRRATSITGISGTAAVGRASVGSGLENHPVLVNRGPTADSADSDRRRIDKKLCWETEKPGKPGLHAAADLGADFNPEWHSGTSVGTPDPRTPSATAAPSRAHSSANRAGHVVTSHTTSVTRVINSADPAASRAVQCHPRDHQVPTERPPRPPQRPTSALHSAQRAPIERHQCPPWPTAVPSAASAPNAKPYERLPSSRATAVPTERSPHRSALPRVSRATGSAHPRVHQERSPRSPSAIRSASLSSAHRAASAPSVAFSAHQQRPSSGVSAQQAPSAAPTERQSPRPQQRPAAPSAAQPLTSRTHRAPTGAPAATTSVSHCRTSAAPAVRPPHHAPGSAQRPVTPLGALTE
ncbi:serine/arginine repetitive matrix protein 1-like [Drosophila suzukii]|uniref:Serine/arginine repetitive matrix protein 1-like n=1 Tax=Drosophila suzukii TaxID=28584 RepID=A0ABM4TZG2_DROSZ